jgi:hypothetical protein
MKKIILTINVMLALSTAKAQLFSHLGAGLYKDALSMTTDEKGNVAALTPGKLDSFEFHLYHKNTNKWSRLNSAKMDPSLDIEYGNLFLVNDTIYCTINNVLSTKSKNLLRITASSVDVFANVYGFSFNCNFLGNKMVLTGQFDSIEYNGVTYKIRNQAWLDGKVWKPTSFSDNIVQHQCSYPILAIKGDTLGYIRRIDNKHYLKRYTLSGYQSNLLVKTHKTPYDSSSLFALPSGFILAVDKNDTLLNISGNTIKALKPNNNFRFIFGMAGYGDKVIFLSKDKFMYQWNTLTDNVIQLYNLNDLSWSNCSRFIRNTDKEFILGNYKYDIEHNGINYSRIAKINSGSATASIDNSSQIKIDQSWRIFPNPAEENINIGYIQKPLSFTVFDAQGRIVWKQAQKISEKIQIPTEQWNRGIYMITDSDGNTGKFILR